MVLGGIVYGSTYSRQGCHLLRATGVIFVIEESLPCALSQPQVVSKEGETKAPRRSPEAMLHTGPRTFRGELV